MAVRAILFDTRSIQRYIFSGTKLKTNIGASFIVDRLFQDVLVEKILRGRFGVEMDADSWQRDDADCHQMTSACRVAYIGGGNALILFKEDIAPAELQQIVTDFTTQLLVDYPGLHTGAAIGKLDLSSPENYKETYQVLHDELKKNQNTIFPQVNIPYTGLTLTCEINGEAANHFDEITQRFISKEAVAKIEKEAEANKALRAEFEADIKGYDFPAELDRLGQRTPENYIAIVHIDGNNMGKKFNSCKDLSSRIAMSRSISRKTRSTFAALLRGIVKDHQEGRFGIELNQNKKGEYYLPIRPLILGGDDITFICAGKVALEYTKRYIEMMRVPDGETEREIPQGIDCCAGIAILRTSYPFFRGYELAEQLCGEAKKKSRPKEGSCWLDFALLHGEQAPTIGQIREQEYTGSFIKRMHFGPYEIGGDGASDLDNLLDTIWAVQTAIEEKRLARNKVKELRYVLQRSEHDIKSVTEQMLHRKKTMPACAAWAAYEDRLWAEADGERKTPYVDVIELLDFVCPGGAGYGEE